MTTQAFSSFVHPFPARMAPDLIVAEADRLALGSVVLDPMMGSGSFVLHAARRGHLALGIDSDPMSLLLTEAACSPVSYDETLEAFQTALSSVSRHVDLAALVQDAETVSFIRFWFDDDAVTELTRIALAIRQTTELFRPTLWCAFSRMIVTKDSGVSRARDVSHSRPHIVREYAKVRPAIAFPGALRTVTRRAKPAPVRPQLLRADARRLPLAANTIDAVVTSPPYLNAIDYLRGHRMSLVWMGHSVSALRELRGKNIGTERGLPVKDQVTEAAETAAVSGTLSARKTAIMRRYARDLFDVMSELSRVLRPGGMCTMVVASSAHNGAMVSVARLTESLAELTGFTDIETDTRELPASRRYLPTPSDDVGPLGKRMRREDIIRCHYQG